MSFVRVEAQTRTRSGFFLVRLFPKTLFAFGFSRRIHFFWAAIASRTPRATPSRAAQSTRMSPGRRKVMV